MADSLLTIYVVLDHCADKFGGHLVAHLSFPWHVIFVLIAADYLYAVPIGQLNESICDVGKLPDLQLKVLHKSFVWTHRWQ